MRVDRDASPVVLDRHDALVVDGDADLRAVPAHELVHGVVHRLVDELVQTPLVRPADVHPRPAADGFHPLENLDILGGVGVGPRIHLLSCHYPS